LVDLKSVISIYLMKKSYHMILPDRGRIVGIIVFFAVLFGSGICSGQLNLKVGYTLGFYSPEVSNGILEEFDNLSSLSFDQYNPSRPINLTFGINLGLRYKFSSSSVELHWESLARSTSSVGISRPNPASLSAVSMEFNYRFNMLMLSYESNFGIFGVGSTIGYNIVSIEQTVQNSQVDSNLLFNAPNGRDQYFIRFNIALNFTGNANVSFAIKPYIHIPLSDIDLLSKAQILGVQSDETRESFPAWGLSFSFYNGRQ